MSAPAAHVARYWRTTSDGRVLCELCPRECQLADGQAGFCYVRRNEGGQLVLSAWGRSTGFAVDPIEKKPLNHFLPGTDVLSFGTAGCNLGCRFCQNWDISKARLSEARSGLVTPEEIVALAKRTGSPSLAYTYNDPVIWTEFVVEVSRAARAAGLRNVLVTAGYVSALARADLFELADAANVDLKAFTEAFYRKETLGHIEPVKETLAWLAREGRVWFEVTTLLIPGLNDGDAELRDLATWIGRELGVEVPLHFTAFHPDYKMLDRAPTPPATLTRARRIAREVGLRHVYTGNVHDREGATTLCAGCGATLIERDWHAVTRYRLRDGACPDCGVRLAGVFDEGPRGPTRNRRRLLGILGD